MDHEQPPAQQLWNDTLGQFLHLANTTKAHNVDLEDRIMQLEHELYLYRKYCDAIPAAEPALEKDLVLCVIDGDVNVFNQSFIRKGEQGGYEAAQTLGKGIADYLHRMAALGCIGIPARPAFWATIFLDKSGLYDTLVSRNVCTSAAFDAFFRGFSQASPRFVVADVGRSGDSADKITEYLQTYLSFPQTLRVFFAGSDAAAYQTSMAKLDQRQLLGSLVLLDGMRGVPPALRNLCLPSITLDGLFMERDPTPLTPAASPVLEFSRASAKTFPSSPVLEIPRPRSRNFSCGLASPQSPTVPIALAGSPRLIDPSKPLHRQSPPPCNEHYLMSCSKGSECKYSHEYLLTPDELDMLAASAKKAPCTYLKRGLPCENGANCCWGHACPHGSQCYHYSKKKCWFKGEGMHDLPPIDVGI